MKNVQLVIDGKQIAAPAGTSVLRAALDNGIYIPNLCFLPGAPPEASCRLCFVEIEGYPRPATSCTEPVREGMVVNTKGAEALRLSRRGFELLMSTHPTDCARCPANRSCELQKIAHHLRVKLKTEGLKKLLRDKPIDTSSPFFIYDPNKCVLCGRCVRICRERVGTGGIGFVRRGFQRTVSTFGEEPVGKSRCGECSECVRACPAGALVFRATQSPQRLD